MHFVGVLEARAGLRSDGASWSQLSRRSVVGALKKSQDEDPGARKIRADNAVGIIMTFLGPDLEV